MNVGSSYAGPIAFVLEDGIKPHISYLHFYNSGIIRYVYFDGSKWRYDDVVERDTPFFMRYQDLAIDGKGHAHIVFELAGIESYTHVDDPSQWSALTFASYRDMNFEIYTTNGGGTNLGLTQDDKLPIDSVCFIMRVCTRNRNEGIALGNRGTQPLLFEGQEGLGRASATFG